MIISAVYTFGIKGGIGSARISEHLGHLQIEGVAAVSESSVHRLTNEIIGNILWYKELQEKGLEKEASETMTEMEVVLGLDETWLDENAVGLSGFNKRLPFFEGPGEKRDVESWQGALEGHWAKKKVCRQSGFL